MNPIFKKNDNIEAEFKNVDFNTKKWGYSSQFFVRGDFKWYISCWTIEKDNIQYLRISLSYIDCSGERQDRLVEAFPNFEIIDSNGKVFKFKDSASIKRSDLQKIPGTEKIEKFTVKCDFSYKIYDFSKNSERFSDGIFQVKGVEFHVNKRYFAEFSKYFYEKFVTKDETTITIKDVSTAKFVELLAALLPDPIKINSGNHANLLELSENFEIASLTQRCHEYFKNNKSAGIIQQIKDADKNGELSKITTILENIDRVKDLKILMDDKNFENLQDSTKLEFLKVAHNLI